ncbi:MAG: sugar phosphate isomerase/epimerase family protein [Planctomycetia bacterium]|nr:sugar phosphate isomerase/epimerase family protein [Planctomycetia bacterium]
MNRREMLGTAFCAAALASTGTLRAEENEVKNETTTGTTAAFRRPNPLAVSSYSFFRIARSTMEQCVHWAAEMGFSGLEILEKQMYLNPKAGKITSSVVPGGGQMFQTYETNPQYLQELKRIAFLNGIDLCGYATHQSFVHPDKEFRQKNIDTTIAGIETAYALGIPVLRVNTGRWGTSKDFQDLMNNKGVEPPMEGYSEDDAFPWVVESIEKCLPVAEKCGVILGLENHWGLARRAEGAIKLINALQSPWFRVILDTGNLLDDDRYEQMAQLAPHSCFVHAKFYHGGGVWYSIPIDYERVFKILGEANFAGYISVEYEGRANPLSAVREARKELMESL